MAATLAISWFSEHTKLVFTSATCCSPAWNTIPLYLQMAYPLTSVTTFKNTASSENPYLTNIARISTSSVHYPLTCYHSLSSPEILYACTHPCKHTHIHILIYCLNKYISFACFSHKPLSPFMIVNTSISGTMSQSVPTAGISIQ